MNVRWNGPTWQSQNHNSRIAINSTEKRLPKIGIQRARFATPPKQTEPDNSAPGLWPGPSNEPPLCEMKLVLFLQDFTTSCVSQLLENEAKQRDDLRVPRPLQSSPRHPTWKTGTGRELCPTCFLRPLKKHQKCLRNFIGSPIWSSYSCLLS